MSACDDAERRLFADTLACDDEFPFVWHPAASRHALADAARRAENTLRAMALLDDTRGEEDGAEALPPRIEAKVDLALSMLGLIVAQQQAIPAPQPVHWSRHGFRLELSAAPEDGSNGLLSVYLLPGMPLPVDLPVLVLCSAASAHGASVWLQVPDTPLALRTALERELFRRHRRLVHEQRVIRR